MQESAPPRRNIISIYETIGGLVTCQRLSERFHERIDGDPELRVIFPKNMQALTERFALYLVELFGGPATYTAARGKQSLLCRHAHLSISTQQAERWLANMSKAMEDADIAEPARRRMGDLFLITALPLADPYLPLYQLPLEELTARIIENPDLVHQSESGHSLLRNAVWRWDVARVRALLEHGANANAHRHLSHGPLYWATNTLIPGREAQGREIVQLLIQYKADVNWPSGPGKSTPMHMAARRGNVLLAEILLDAGADMERSDSKGETPLRRAVNCAQNKMVDFLLSRGANPLSRDKQQRTPLDAARR